jgi:hypothetical protein
MVVMAKKAWFGIQWEVVRNITHRDDIEAFQVLKVGGRDARDVKYPIFRLVCGATLPELTVMGLKAMPAGPDVWCFSRTQNLVHACDAFRHFA